MKHVTLKDIAQEMKVAISTVSRALNGAEDINKETKERILAKAEAMGYRPNPIARILHSQKSYQIGVVVPELHNDFFPMVFKGIRSVLKKAGYQSLIMESDESSALEIENVKKLEGNMVDGLLVSLSKESANIDYYNDLYERGMPMVFFNRVNEKLLAPKIVFNDFKWAFFAVEHLIRQGYKKIYHLSGHRHLTLSKERIKGYEGAMQKFQLPYEKDYIIETDFSKEAGEAAVERMIAQGNLPEAIFVVNDYVAFGVMRALKKAKLRIPEDVALVGFTEGQWTDLVDPPLTSVRQPMEQIGIEAAQMLLRRIENESTDQQYITLDGALNIRASSKGRES